MAYVLAHFVQVADAVAVTDALSLGFWLWLGFMAPILIGSVLWEGKSCKLFVLNGAHWLLAILAMAVILVLWQ